MAAKLVTFRNGYKIMSEEAAEFDKYEKAIFSGKIQCPFTAEFVADNGNSCKGPIPLTPSGKPKIDLFS